MKVAAIVPHWNRSDLLRSLLANLAQQTRPFDEIVVVDNGSTDDSKEVARGVRFLELGNNLGFAAAVNRGIAATSAAWVAILNNDVLLDADWLRIMEAQMSDADFLTGKLLVAANPRLIDGTFDELAASGCAYRCGAGKADGGEWDTRQTIRFAPMTAALFRRSLFAEIGPLEEGFESYLEDVEFGLRCALARKSGRYVPEARGTHQGSATGGVWRPNTVRLLARNQMLLVFKHFGGQPRGPQVAGQMLWGFLALRHGRLWSWLKGKWQGWRLRSRVRRVHHPELAEILAQSEQHIFDIQRRTGFDSYWRFYFWLRGR